MLEKMCSRCHAIKSVDDFVRDKGRRDGRFPWCKPCTNRDRAVQAKMRREADPEKYLLKDQAKLARDKARRDADLTHQRAKSKARYRANPGRARINAVRHLFKIDFNVAWESQEGLCACCGEPMLPSGRGVRSVCVDHDRSCCSGRKSCGRCVRGLIHAGCNRALGLANDDPTFLRDVLRYLAVPRPGYMHRRGKTWSGRDRKFNIDFNAMGEAQNWLCACCLKPMTPNGKGLDSVCVDHDHAHCPSQTSCGQCVRGLIHVRCNLLLGFMSDNSDTIRRAMGYLEQWGTRISQTTPVTSSIPFLL